MANDNNKKSALKSTAEVVATTSTILVAGKTIASVIESTATSVKDMYAEIKATTSTPESDAEKAQFSEANGEILPEAEVKGMAGKSTLTDEIIQSDLARKTLNAVENFSQSPKVEAAVVSEPVGEITESSDDVALISTEPLEEELDQEEPVETEEYSDILTDEINDNAFAEANIPVDSEDETEQQTEELYDLTQETDTPPSNPFEDTDSWNNTDNLLTDASTEQTLTTETPDNIV